MVENYYDTFCKYSYDFQEVRIIVLLLGMENENIKYSRSLNMNIITDTTLCL